MIYRYIYKITCTTGSFKDKFYFGQHTTENLNDGYKGSSKLLGIYYKKHPNDYIKEIIAFYDSKEELNKAEYDIIHPWINNPMCLNLKDGGIGGSPKGRIPWNKGLQGCQTAWNKGVKGVSEETSSKMKQSWEHRKPDSQETRNKKSIAAKNRKPDSQETRNKKSKNAIGNQYSLDHKWMSNSIDKPIYPHISQIDYYLNLGYHLGRK